MLARTLLLLAPDIAATHWTLAMVLLGLKRWDGVHAAAEQGTKLQPERWEGHALLGDIASRCRRWSDAERHYRFSLTIEPRHAAVLNALGVALIRLGKEEAGLQAFRAAVSVDPRMREPKRNFWMAVRGAPDLIGSDWRRTSLIALLVFCVGPGAIALMDVSLPAVIIVVGGLCIWVWRLRRARSIRLANVQEDPELRALLERVDQDSQAR